MGFIRFFFSLRFIITVEPIFFSYIAIFALQKPLLQEFLLDYFGKVHNFTAVDNQHLCGLPRINNSRSQSQDNSELKKLEDLVQAETSYFFLYLSLSSTIPSLFTSIIYGSWSDRVGRKPVLILCLFGGLMQCVSVVLVADYEFPYYLLFIGSAVDGLCGSFSCVMFSGFAYLSDITDIKKRGVRIGILESVIYVGATASFFISGIWVRESGGYKQPFWGCAGIALFTVLYTLVILPESLSVTHSTKKRNSPSCTGAFRTAVTVFNARPTLYVGSAAFFLVMFGVLNDIQVMYVKASPLCWSDSLVGYWLSIGTAVKAIGLVVGTKILSMFISDSLMVVVGILANIASYLLTGFAETTLIMFLTLVPQIPQGLATASLRTAMSKLGPPDKQGVVFSVVGVVQSLCAVFAPLMYNTVYPVGRSEMNFPGFCFILAAIIMLPVIPLMLYIHCKIKRGGSFTELVVTPEDEFASDTSETTPINSDQKGPCYG